MDDWPHRSGRGGREPDNETAKETAALIYQHPTRDRNQATAKSVTRGLRQGRTYTLTLNGEPLARMVPIRRRRAVPKEEVLAIFATAPVDQCECRSSSEARRCP